MGPKTGVYALNEMDEMGEAKTQYNCRDRNAIQFVESEVLKEACNKKGIDSISIGRDREAAKSNPAAGGICRMPQSGTLHTILSVMDIKR